jgi:hypothetical protein
MSTIAHSPAFRRAAALPTATAATPKARYNPLRWLYDAVMKSRERQTQRDVDRVVSWRDGGFNDRFEQEIAERFYSDGWNRPR